jgi:signal transduction histidine kinase
MRQRGVWIALAAMVLASGAFAAMARRGTPGEARAMLDKAIEHYRSAGRQQALADFNAGKAPFADRDLYVFCLGKDHKTLANGGFPALVGTSADAVRDADGRPLPDQMWAAASAGGTGSVEYRWFNPVTRRVEPKISFVHLAGDDLCGVGAYDPPRTE